MYCSNNSRNLSERQGLDVCSEHNYHRRRRRCCCSSGLSARQFYVEISVVLYPSQKMFSQDN